jgi:hypothetical protein
MLNSHKKRVVLILQGSNTRGAWTREACQYFAQRGVIPIPYDYGHVALWQIYFPWVRRQKLALIHKIVQEIQSEYGVVPSVVCHSFGTWLVSRLLTERPNTRFHNVILTGAIVRCDYDWNAMLKADATSTCQVYRVINEKQTQDSAVKYEPLRSLADFGKSGIRKFEGVEQQYIDEGRFIDAGGEQGEHSDSLRKESFLRWASFVANPEISPRSDTLLLEVVFAEIGRIAASLSLDVANDIQFGVYVRSLATAGGKVGQLSLLNANAAELTPPSSVAFGNIPDVFRELSPVWRCYLTNTAKVSRGESLYPNGPAYPLVALVPLRRPNNGEILGVVALAILNLDAMNQTNDNVVQAIVEKLANGFAHVYCEDELGVGGLL